MLKTNLRGVETSSIPKKIVKSGKDQEESKFPEQFSVGPSLPPFVEGQLRCFLHLTLGEIKWMIPRPKQIKVGVKWWGQQSTQIFLQPKSSASSNSRLRNEVKFPIRSGPKQFTAYLKDMGTLVLDIVVANEKIGQVDIQEIGLLCQSQPIQGFFPLLAFDHKNKQKEIGALFVSLQFQSISGSFNMTSSTIPTVDMPGLQQSKKTHSLRVPKSLLKRIHEPLSGETKKKHQKEVKISSSSPERIEYSVQSPETERSEIDIESARISPIQLRQQESTVGLKDPKDLERSLLRREIHNQPDSHDQDSSKTRKQKDDAIPISPILSEDGNKETSGQVTGQDRSSRKVRTPPLSDVLESSPDEREDKQKSSGHLLKDILDQVEDGESVERMIDESLMSRSNETLTERALVDLVTGDDSKIDKILRRLDSDGSLSNEFSDTDDPLYDDSLLTDLFYTKKDASDVSSFILTDESDEELQTGANESVTENPNNAEYPQTPNRISNRGYRRKDGTVSKRKPDRRTSEVRDSSNSTNEEVEISESLQYIDPKSEKKEAVANDEFVRQLDKLIPEGMDLNAITTLARAHFARVVIYTLELHKDFSKHYPKCTFFVEYEFPVNAVDSKGKMSCCTEMTRCASNKLSDEGVLFNHRSIFPVHFDADTLVRWWDKLLLFKVFVRSANNPSPVLIGRAVTALRPLLLEENFLLEKNIPLQQPEDYEKRSVEKFSKIGNLQVTIELGCEKSDLKKKKIAIQHKPDSNINDPVERVEIIDYSSTHQKPNSEHPVPVSKETNQKLILKQEYPSVVIPELLHNDLEIELSSLLLIPEGRGISLASARGIIPTSNSYLACRMLWHEDVPKSEVCWNTVDPKFDFCHSIPVLLNDQLLQKIKNNFMVIEVWHKHLAAESDKLVGIVKICLQPFYLSFKERSLVKTLLGSQYPVIAVDGWVAVQDLFVGDSHGDLRVTLALGNHNQIQNLLKMKNENGIKKAEASRRGNREIEHERNTYKDALLPSAAVSKHSVEHIFGISVETAKEMVIDQNSDSDEKDCFAQYQFPVQNNRETDSSLKWHKTPTTLYLPNPVFNHSVKHSVTLPSATPVQNFLLNAYNSEKHSNIAGVQFEIWQRSYYPNIRDCLLYKALLPTAKLCAMVTMSKQKEATYQSFQLPLTRIAKLNSKDAQSEAYGFLNVSINYQKNPIVDREPRFNETKNPCVCISVCVLRASGLKACLVNSKKTGKQLQDLAPSGFNAFIKVFPSFLGRASTRTSQVIARSFAPTFSYHVDFPVSILDENLADDDYEETSSLAYQLESEHLEIEVHHQPSKSSFLPLRGSSVQENEEVMIGKCKIPLIGLLSRQTGIKGWFPLLQAEKSRRPQFGHESRFDSDEMEKIIGGLELVIKFANPTDRELVINVARGIGWSPIESLEMHDESYTDPGNNHGRGVNATIFVEKLWLSKDVLDNVNRQESQDLRGFRVYCRYKFYDKAALSSKAARLEKISPDMVSANLSHKGNFDLFTTAALSWYLREEVFEVQFWLKSQGNEESYVTQKSRDRLLGSAYVDLTNIAKAPEFRGTKSGLYPLFKFGADNMRNSCVRITLRFQDPDERFSNIGTEEPESLTSDYPFDEAITDPGASSGEDTRIQKPFDAQMDKPVSMNIDDSLGMDNEDESASFKFRIVIEEALHLPITDNSKEGTDSPKIYASYQLTPLFSTIYTKLVHPSSKPNWSFEKKELFDPLKIVNQKISFKVFRKTSDGGKPDVTKDVLIGTAVVDISPLRTGFQQIYGWYNIADFSGQCAGQIKVGVIPERPLATSPSSRYFKKEALADKIYSSYPSACQMPIPFNLNQELQERSVAEPHVSNNAPLRYRTESRYEEDVTMIPQSIAESSKSMLFSKLRDQMGELDSITNSLRSKFLTDDKRRPTAAAGSNVGAQNQHSVEQNERDVIYHHSPPIETLGLSKKTHLTEKNDIDVVFDRYSPTGISANAYSTEKQADEREYLAYSERNHGTLLYGESVLDNKIIDKVITDGRFDPTKTAREELLIEQDEDCLSENSVLFPSKGDQEKTDAMDRDYSSALVEIGVEGTSPNLESLEYCDDVAVPNDGSAESVNSLQNERELDSFDDVLTDWKKYSEHVKISDLSDDNFVSSQSTQNSINLENLQVGNIKEPGTNEIEFQPDYSGFVRNRQFTPVPSNIEELSGPGRVNDIQIREEINDDHLKIPSDAAGNNFDSEGSVTEGHQSELTEEIPNFFMPTEKLAESLRKLRLAASFPRDAKSDHSRASVSKISQKSQKANSEIEQQYSRRKNFYTTKESKPNLSKPPPLQTSEISRIASIFSSKFSE